MQFENICYEALYPRQKENYNYQKVSSILADYGFATHHINGHTLLKVQQKSRLTFVKKHREKEVFICFPYKEVWYQYEHDTLLGVLLNHFNNRMAKSTSWIKNRLYTWNSLIKTIKKPLKSFKIY